VRLFEPTGTRRSTTLAIPSLGVTAGMTLSPFEVRTLAVDLAHGELYQTDLLEQREP
jgi:alpha-mannosidase